MRITQKDQREQAVDSRCVAFVPRNELHCDPGWLEAGDADEVAASDRILTAGQVTAIA